MLAYIVTASETTESSIQSTITTFRYLF